MQSLKIWIVSVVLAVASVAQADQVQLVAAKDNTLYENTGGVVSNGAGDHIFVGTTNTLAIRRALVAFDVAAALPAGSTINSATLTLYMSQTNAGIHAIGLHRVLVDWGEGTSHASGSEGSGGFASAGDATWIHTFFDTQFWSSVGGDYYGVPTATTAVGFNGFFNWTSNEVASEVQNWLDSPSTNYGWVLIGEESTGDNTAKRFNSRTFSTPSQRPTLTVDFTPPVTDGACCDGSSCSIVSEADCDLAGGVFHGVDSECAPNPCTLPTGACCESDGSCVELPAASCSNVGGIHQGTGTSCTPGACPEPVGACCADSGTCSLQTEANCLATDGTYQGSGTDCSELECPVVLEPFVDALPIPGVAQPVSGSAGGAASYEIAAEEFQQSLHRDLPPSTLWGYEGQVPGPTIETAAGQTVTVTWQNDIRDDTGTLRTEHFLPVDLCPHGPSFAGASPRTVVHLHGAHVEAEFDGYPEDTILPGEQQVYVYGNDQLPATLWYHDHALGITRLNLYLGLAGFWIIRDPEELALPLPSGEYEIPLMIQDRSFHPDGSLKYPADWQDHFFGDKILVNGKVWPYLDVKQGKYRFRLLNGSGSRTYALTLDNGMSFQVIGTDGGLLPAPVSVTEIVLSPAERADVILDFEGLAPGTEILMLNSAPSPYPGSPGVGVVPDVMKFVVGSDGGDPTAVPTALRSMEILQEVDSVSSRDFDLYQVPDACTGTAWSINGLRWDDITEYPSLDTTEIWRFVNRSGIMHPMHMHLVMFQVLDRQPFEMVGGVPTPTGPAVPPPAEEAGWKDTVQAMPNEITRVIARFEDYTGKFAYHCHIVEHEDNEMMRQFQTVDCGNSIVEPSESCDDGNRDSGDGCNDRCLPEEFVELRGLAQGGTVQLSVDGISFYEFPSNGETPEQVVAAFAAQINQNSTLMLRGVSAIAVGTKLIVFDGTLDVVSISDPGLNATLSLAVGRTSLWWSHVQGASSSDLLRGDLTDLLSSGGDYTVGTGLCLRDNESGNIWNDATVPAPGVGYWYLVRADSGSYDSSGPGLVRSRDAEIAASGVDCF